MSIRQPDRRRHSRPDASRALRNGIAGGPQRGRPQTPFNPGAAGDRVKCAQRKKCFMPNAIAAICDDGTYSKINMILDENFGIIGLA